MKGFVKNIILSVTVFGFFLMLIEVVLRTTHLFGARISWAEPHEVYGWRFAPKAEYWNRPLEGGRSSGVINSYGWRDVEWSSKKTPGVYRVAVIGDSYVEAFQVELSETLLKLAENILLKRGYRTELMNFGRSGFTTTEELLVIKDEVLHFSPDLVALFFNPPNDIPDVSKDLVDGETRPFFVHDSSGLKLDTSFTTTRRFKLKKLISAFKRKSALVSLVIERYYLLRASRSKTSLDADCKIRGYLTLATSTPNSLYSKAFELNKSLIRETAALVKGRTEMLLVTIDSFGWKTIDEQCLKSKDPSFDPFYYEDELRKLALTENLYYLGLQREFRKDWEKNQGELHWGHWNYEGHKLVAALLAEKIMDILDSRLADKASTLAVD